MAAASSVRSSAMAWCLLLVLASLLPSSQECGPGRGGHRRRGSKKMTPLVFKQHVPNVAENTLMASGIPDGRITRDSPAFKDLVTNLNPEIIFKDEEGTGADRLMSQRCKDKLTTLSISVMNQWPGVRLRVTEAWDEDSHHAVDSLHYEGRAVDITTSDRDKSKYGTLARLAYEAGFDWVYYESRGHIHCSVKSDNSMAVETGGCFPAQGTVTLADGTTTTMDRLSIGDHVQAIDDDGSLVYSEVIMFFHQSRNRSSTYYEISLDNGSTLSATGSHLVYVAKSKMAAWAGAGEAVYAGKVAVGMYMYVVDDDEGELEGEGGSKMSVHEVVAVRGRSRQGIYAPLTKHGTIVVDHVAVSCYAWIESHTVAHASLFPVRAFYDVSRLLGWETLGARDATSDAGVEADDSGVHWYAGLLHSLAPYVVPSHLLFSSS